MAPRRVALLTDAGARRVSLTDGRARVWYPPMTRAGCGVLLIAHRGASAEAPESTRAAIQRAVALRADMIELDVQLTRDARLVIFHDERLERTTNGHGHLADWSYADLARLDCGAWFAPRFSGQRMMLVSHVLQETPTSTRINLELKRTARPLPLIEGFVRCLRWTRAASRVLASSFDASLLERLQRADARVAKALLCRHRPGPSLRTAVRLGCTAFHPHASLVTRRVVDDAHASGLRVHAWTVDEPQEARRLIDLGVDGLVTNRPDRLDAVCHPKRA